MWRRRQRRLERRGDSSTLAIAIGFAVLIAALAACGGAAPEEAAPAATYSVTVSRASVKAGGLLELRYAFAATEATLDANYWVMAHFVDADGELLWVDDHRPPTPSREWQVGKPVEYARSVFVPESLPAGDVTLLVGLYSPDTQARVPMAGQEVGRRAYKAAVFKLGPAEAFDYKDGWYDHEGTPLDPVRWRWTKRQATLGFRNPKTNAVLYLEVEAAEQFPSPLHVTVAVGGQPVDEFEAPPKGRVLRRVSIQAARLGTGDMTEAVISVDRTYSPAELSGGASPDTRQLGIRVFNVAIDVVP